MNWTYVYIIAKQDGDKFTSPVKVGATGDPEKRLQSLKTSCPFPVRLFFCVALPDRPAAFDVERRFKSLRWSKPLHGEWYDMDPSHAAWVMISNLFFYWQDCGVEYPDIAKMVDENLEFCRHYNEALYA